MPPENQPAPANSGVRVDSLRIANFRSLLNVELALGEISVFVGMNNSGKTSLLRALHLALGADRRMVAQDDFYVDQQGNQQPAILIDARIIPIGADGTRAAAFPQAWIDSDFGGNNLISLDTQDRQFVAFRTRVTQDVVRSDFTLERLRLAEWPNFATWQAANATGKVARFDQLASYFVDAQRDVVGDLKTRSSYLGRLLSKVEIPAEAIADLEERLQTLNRDIVGRSPVLSHVRDSLTLLNQTVPAFGDGVEITPVSKTLRDITKGLGLQFSDSAGCSFPLESHGMGTRSWASLLSFEAYISWTERLTAQQGLPFHPVLFLEEPEAHLHPNAQRSVHGQLTRGVGQRIVSTHSPYIAGQAKLSELVYFAKSAGQTQIRRLPDNLLPEEERKIRREIFRSRGELLFSKMVVLFEGETEEQALPLFARHHWNCHPFECGASFVGVGGDGNYLPFLRLFDALKIPWYIFSDGEPSAQARVTAALQACNLTNQQARVTTIPNNVAIEGYLVNEGYQAELRSAVVEYFKPFANGHHEAAKRTEVNGWTDQQLLDFLKSNKTGMAQHWAKAIIAAGGQRALPTAIKDLLDAARTAV